MNTTAKLAIAAAAVLVVVVAAAINLSPGDAPASPGDEPAVSDGALSTPEGAEARVPIAVSAVLKPGDDIGQTTSTEVAGRIERRGTVWSPTLTASDPRLEGALTLSIDQDQYPGPDGPESFVVGSSTARIETGDGAWQGSGPSFSVADESSGPTLLLTGEGAYAGLFAVLDMTDPADIAGLIVPAAPPAAPSASASGGSSQPAATNDPAMAPMAIFAALEPGQDVGHTTFTPKNGRVERRGTVWAPTLTASDPRLEGALMLSIDQDQYPGPDGPESYVVMSSTARIENADGAWQGSGTGFSVAGTERPMSATIVLAGEGAYSGLYAAVDMTDPSAITGVIFPASPPPVPAAP